MPPAPCVPTARRCTMAAAEEAEEEEAAAEVIIRYLMSSSCLPATYHSPHDVLLTG